MKLELTCFDVEGTPTQMGEALGVAARDRIEAMIARRLEVAHDFFKEQGQGAVEDLLRHGAASLDCLESWDFKGWEEFVATAKGADVAPEVLHAAANYTDMRDLVCCRPINNPADEGCTSVAVPGNRTKSGMVLVGQTWDLHLLDLETVVAVHRLPAEQPETWSVTVAGGPTLIGMNEHGLWVGTTNIQIDGVQDGVGYLNVLHRAIRCRAREDAALRVQSAPRSAAHTFLVADAGGAIELECSALTTVRREMRSEPMVRTNHCLDARHIPSEAEQPTPSSLARFARATDLLGRHDVDEDMIRVLMTDRDDGVDSINRWPEDGEQTATNACLIGCPDRRRLEACRGSADRGQWEHLGFRA
ncbi:MAG: C45 family peptidase [Phycisphaerales bacterium]|nr:C45 family peptidase [Phycisphaerales bacterium]